MGIDVASNMIAYYTNYTPAGDVLTIALCIVIVILVRTAYINRTRTFLYFRHMVAFLFLSAVFDIFYHMLMNSVGKIPDVLIYITRTAFHLALYAILLMFVLYAGEMLHLDSAYESRLPKLGLVGYVVLAILEIIGTPLKIGFYFNPDGSIHTGLPFFPAGYIFYVGLIIFMVAKFSDRVFKQIVLAIGSTTVLCMLMIGIQQIHGQSSFTVATFAFPIYALLYLVHSNPYNIETGALGNAAFKDYIKSSYDRKRPFLLMSLYLPEFDLNGGSYPTEIIGTVRFFAIHFFRSTKLFQVSNGHLILAIDVQKNPDYKEKNGKMVAEFNRVYPRYQRDYKIVGVMNDDTISKYNDYKGFIDYIHSTMSENSIVMTEEKDIKSYYDYKFITSQLKDIHDNKDMDDPRVEVYCQPVYNIHKGIYDTAEALMRLRLPNLGMVFPDKFIPIAEKNGYIQTLTRIILNKTCSQIGKMLSEGYNVRRISVNFSIFDVRENDFCSMVEKLIRKNGIPSDKIAIEITESQNEYDFEVIKERITELKDTGMKFYLDDFGTGYSNFERIMELPFDIIKFDRSLVIASSNDDKMRAMVSHLAKMFNDMDYAVLYEGIEDEDDEARCIDMSAKYLQGYKYSKPIPITDLTEYFVKTS